MLSIRVDACVVAHQITLRSIIRTAIIRTTVQRISSLDAVLAIKKHIAELLELSRITTEETLGVTGIRGDRYGR